MAAWALQLRSNELESLATLWHLPAIEALVDTGVVWLRGDELDDESQRLLKSLPCEARFEVLPDGGLLRSKQLVPRSYLPVGNWQPLRRLLTVSLPQSSLPARQHEQVSIQFVPSTESSVPNVLLTDLESWVQYANSAPQVRLRCCQFAVSADQRVLIFGSPLPPIAGQRAVARSGLVVPSGWTWSPQVDAALLAKAWGVESGDLWLMWPGQPIEQIPAAQLVAASRSAVQQTWEAFHHV